MISLKSELKLTLSEMVFITTISTAIGVFWWAYAFFDNIISPFLKIVAMDGIFNGIWLIGGVFFPYIIRKPGSAILGEGMASFIECLISQWGVSSIMCAIIQALPIELFFLLLRYKKWDMFTLVVAGLISGFCEGVLTIFWYQYYKLGISYNIAQLIIHSFSGAIIAGLLSKFLADKLVKTGVLNHFNIVRQTLLK